MIETLNDSYNRAITKVKEILEDTTLTEKEKFSMCLYELKNRQRHIEKDVLDFVRVKD